jgi:prophage tail gpP-like protein
MVNAIAGGAGRDRVLVVAPGGNELMSGILSSIGDAFGFDNGPDPANEIAIVVGGNRIVGWENVSITRSIEQFPSSFVLTAADQFPYDPTRATIFRSGPGKKCQIYIGADLVLTGYVDQYSTNVGTGHHDVTITGRGLCEDLSDCSADLLNTPELRGATILASNALDLAQKLCKPFGITARSAVADLGKPLPAITVALGETGYEIIERVARYTGYLVYEDEFGNLVLDRVGTQKMASGFTMPGNIEGASSTLAFNQRFSTYVVVWNSVAQYGEINPLANQRASIDDAKFIARFPHRYRPRIIVSEQVGPSPAGANVMDYWADKRAKWELARRIGRSQAISLTCDSWRDSAGQLWKPNYLAPISAVALKILNVEWIIGTVTFRKDASGTHADLVLMPPDAFDPEPAPLYLWDAEIMHALQTSQSPAPPTTAPPKAIQGRL